MLVTLISLLGIGAVAVWLTLVLIEPLVEHTFWGRSNDDGLQVESGFWSWGSALVALLIDALAGYLVGLVFHIENIWFPLGGAVVGIVFIILAIVAGNKTDGTEYTAR